MMIELLKDSVFHQCEASLCMLGTAIDNCPDSLWNEPVIELQFCQVAFHTLFFTDLYLGPDLTALQEQAFHMEHATIFAGYEELENRIQQASYDRGFLKKYLDHCRDKVAKVIASETEDSLQEKAGFDWLDISRAELYIYNIRHVHHHAAQLSLWLKSKERDGIAWVKSGWIKNSE